MARTEVAIDDVSLNAGVELTKTVAAAGATGASGYKFTGAKASEDLRIVVRNDGATGVITIKAGDYEAATSDLSVTIGGGGRSNVITIDGAKYRQNDGSIDIDVGGATGVFEVFQ
jgi:hypothetical protein